MANFNKSVKGTNTTVNKSGHVAYSMQDKDKLVTQVLTSFFGESKFYGDTTDELKETAARVIGADPKFIANLARYARKEMHLRSVSHFLTALVASTQGAKQYIKAVVADVVERVDDITEILSCYISMFGRPIPNSLKKALSAALNKFNEFQFSKYNGGSKALKLRDVLRLIHPTPKSEEQSKIFKKILEDTLETAERWETELSANGNNKETWDKLIAENKIGYMAALKNLRNMINSKAEMGKIYDMLENKERVLKSKQLPFRFYSAYRELQNVSGSTSKVFNVLENAIEHSVANLPKLKGITVIGIDKSGSMSMEISSKSTVRCNEIASLIGAIANKLCEEAIIFTFDTNLDKFAYSQRNGILQTAKQLCFNGGGTDVSLPLKGMLQEKIKADRLIMLSDNEINSGYPYKCQRLADEYRRLINPNLWVHAIDLAGYGTQQFSGKNTNIIAGWSEKVLEFITLAEQGIETQVKRISNYDAEKSMAVQDEDRD